MNHEGGSVTRCARHPSQFFTGFCSSCLAERLASVESADKGSEQSCVDSSEKSLRPSCSKSAGKSSKQSCGNQSEIVEVPSDTNTVSDIERKPGDDNGRVRKTLLYLFQLDDNNNPKGKEGDDGENQSGKTESIGATGFMENGRIDRAGVSTSYSAAVDVIVGAHVGKKLSDPSKGENLKAKGVSSWLSLMFSKKAVRWRMKSAPKKKSMHGQRQNGIAGSEELECKTNARHSCDGSAFRNTSKVSWDAPRHSWDGSVMSKALACSFACLDEQEGACYKVKRSFHEETVISGPNLSAASIGVSKTNNVSLAREKISSPDRGGFYEDSQQAFAVSSVIRKKSNRWSKVWDRSITSPFKDFAKKREHVLERSLSESWRDCHKEKNIWSVESINGNGPNSTIKNQCANRGTYAINGDTQNLRPDWQKKKSEFRIGRSRSVHYSSPGNLDNGLLRFYLTPMRSSRRNTSKGRSRTSHSFARGIFGL